MKLLKTYAPVVEQFSIDEAYCDFTGTETLYGDMIAFAHRLKDEIYKELGFSVNIGISCNKLLAKMASDFEKPNKVHTLFPDEISAKMWPLPVSDLLYVGKGTCKKLNTLGIFTIGDLAGFDSSILHAHLGRHGNAIWEFANGRDVSSITSKPAEAKGYGNSITLSNDVCTREEAYVVLLSLCETVASRVRRANVYINVVTVTIMNTEFTRCSHQMRLDNMTNVTEEIYKYACRLFDEKWDGSPIRLLGVSTNKADDGTYIQYSLFDSSDNERLQKLNYAIDEIRNRYGEDSIKRARFLDNDQTHMTGGMNQAKRTGGKSP
jgi:DNA polymerase-4